MSVRLNALTGGTGLLGSHLAEQLVQRGERVRALVRPSSDTSFLRSIGVELIEGDLEDRDALRRLVTGADVVYHSAAHVGDWGPWKLFRRAIIEATERLLDVCNAAAVGRFLYVSSIMVYGHPKQRDGQLFTEEEPLGQKLWMWDYYAKAKITAEALCRNYPRPWTIVRPSWIYGPRDRRTLPAFFKAMRAGRVRLLGAGDNLLNLLYAGDAADGVIRAATTSEAVGQAYTLSSEGEITQKQMLDLLTDSTGWPRITRSMSFRMAYLGGAFSEVIGKLIFLKRRPHITRYAVTLVGRPTLYSSEKAKKQLGWQRKVKPEEGLRLSLEWFRCQPGSEELLKPPD